MARLKGDRLSAWDRTRSSVGCPHCAALDSAGGSTAHIFWDCSAAQTMWNALLEHWKHLWSADQAPSLEESKTAFFSLQLVGFPNLIWEHPELMRLPPPTEAATIATHAAIQAAWRKQVLATHQTIWQRRTTLDGDNEVWRSDHALALLRTRLQASLRDLRWPRTMDSAATPHTAAALELLKNAPLTSRPPRTLGSPHHDQRYLLFFDGGSRGNPGAGGAGAIVVRLCHNDTAAHVIYSAAISCPASTTTNNQAEYEGLLAGLTAAHQHHWTPLAVVGDSMLIIRQMQAYRAPLNKILRTKYARARRIADLLGVNTWMHHPRAANRMADAAANLAMDTAQSSHALHPTTRADHSAIADLLDGDLSYWRRELAP